MISSDSEILESFSILIPDQKKESFLFFFTKSNLTEAVGILEAGEKEEGNGICVLSLCEQRNPDFLEKLHRNTYNVKLSN